MNVTPGLRIQVRLRKYIRKLLKIDWSNPKNVLIACLIVVAPFALSQYLYIGIVVGVMMALSALWMFEKLPLAVKKLCHKYPLVSDISLTTIVVVGVGKMFGAGLTLAISAMVCELILNVSIPLMKVS